MPLFIYAMRTTDIKQLFSDYKIENGIEPRMFFTECKICKTIFASPIRETPTCSEVCDIKSKKLNEVKLTCRETEIIKLTAEGYSSTEIGEKFEISRRTVETHRFNLMKKLQIKKKARLIAYALKNEFLETSI